MKQNEMKFAKNETDTKFAVCAAEASMMEVKMAELALTNSTTPEVKKLARHMLEEHKKTGKELKVLAAKKNITLPEKMGNKSQKMVDCMAKKQGEKFDKAYSGRLKKDHKRDIAVFKREAEKGNDADFRAFATAKLQVLEKHLELTESASYAVNRK
ncbi:MAG: DUF4142 domain-containing protein [Bacteroidota bacterium]|nr:DUF4142 domain-containing protein [Bacteroidota bacterium]